MNWSEDKFQPCPVGDQHGTIGSDKTEACTRARGSTTDLSPGLPTGGVRKVRANQSQGQAARGSNLPFAIGSHRSCSLTSNSPWPWPAPSCWSLSMCSCSSPECAPTSSCSLGECDCDSDMVMTVLMVLRELLGADIVIRSAIDNHVS